MHVQSPGVHSNVGLAPKIGLSSWTKLDGYSAAIYIGSVKLVRNATRGRIPEQRSW